MKLVAETHPLLNKPLERYVFPENRQETVDLANNLGELMNRYSGIGLSANQVGLPHRMFVIRSNPVIGVFINPIIVDQSEELVTMEEGCLSYPGLHVKVTRPAHVKVRFQTVSGETITSKYTGLTARVILHEMDHMDGVNFLDRAGPMARDLALRKWNKLKKKVMLKRSMGYVV